MKSAASLLSPHRRDPLASWFIIAGKVIAFLGVASVCRPAALAQTTDLHPSIRTAQQRVVKVYGAGGSGLEPYQTGMLVSPDGHIATAWSYVLDVPPIVQLDDGTRLEAEVLEFEPRLELAVLKVQGVDLPYFSIDEASDVQFGDAVFAISNLFNIATGNEPASVMRGRVAAISALDARRGTFATPYHGDVLLLDLVANNPGAAGGAVVDLDGRLIGMLGKELRDSVTGVWMNYAIPASVLRSAIGDMIAGRRRPPPTASTPRLPVDQSHSPETLGLRLVPDVMERTPVFVDDVVTDSPAGRSGLMPDDLVLMIDGGRIDGQRDFRDRLRRIDRRDNVALTVQRSNEILIVNVRP